jgi:hypothetical protein
MEYHNSYKIVWAIAFVDSCSASNVPALMFDNDR